MKDNRICPAAIVVKGDYIPFKVRWQYGAPLSFS
jgi:hypothetical protein